MLPAKASVVIIGAGCVGTSTAYQLAKAGVRDIVIVERDYASSGSTGRCGGGMRQQWSTKGNVVLAKHSIDAFRNFENELGQDIDFVQGGYLLPAYTEDMVREFRENIRLQNECGVNTRYVTVDEVKKIAPAFNTAGVLGASYGPTDAKANPFLVVKGYAERAREMGVKISLRNAVVGFEKSGGRIAKVVTERGRIAADWVINAAGGYAAEIAALAGLDVPIKPYRHQILVTEPVEPFLDPMVINLYYNIYFSQAKHGAIITGQTDKDEPSSFNVRENWRFAVEIAKKLMFLAPAIGKLNIVRQWAGLYAMTPDRQPIIGRFSDYENFLIAAGFSGHGFMLSPATGKMLTELIVDGAAKIADIGEYSIERFGAGEFTVEANVV